MSGSNKVDNRVVQMQFNNAQFESNIQTSITSLGNLKKGLNLEGASKGLDQVNASAKHLDLTGIAGNVDKIAGRFTALGVAGVAALASITNQAIKMAEQMVKSLTTPYKQGFAEYEQGLSSFQTILANTASSGSNIDDVNKSLKDMSDYANLTKYSFGDMNSAMGTFTANGVKLNDSVTGIKGIYNLVSVTGGDADKAKSAVWQLSQAIASGTVKLMDWNSVQNAGIGGPDFQNQLLMNAKAMGKSIEMTDKKTGQAIKFRDTLEQGWLTTDVLMATLNQYSGDVTEQQLKSLGLSDEQIKKTMELGKRAVAASTQLKSYSQLQDTLQSNVITGWSTSFKIVIGNLDEATQLWTSVGDVIGGVLGKMADKRNNLLQGWKDLGGRKELIQALANVFKFLGSVIKPIQDAFRTIFPPKTAQDLYNMTHLFLLFSQKLSASGDTIKIIKGVFMGFFSVLKAGFDIIGGVVGGFVKIIGALVTGGDIMGAVGDMFGKVIAAFGKGLDGIVSAFSTDLGMKIMLVFSKIGSTIASIFSGGASGVVTGIKSLGMTIASAFGDIGKSISDKLGYIGTVVSVFFQALGGTEDAAYAWADKTGNSVSGFLDAVDRFGFGIRETILPAFWAFGDGIKKILGDVAYFVHNWKLYWRLADVHVDIKLKPITDALSAFADTLGSIWGGIKDVAGPFKDLIVAIANSLTALFNALTLKLKTDPNTVLDLLNGALLGAIMLNVHKFLKLMEGLPDLMKGVEGMLNGLKGCLKSYQQDLKASALKKIAEALVMLAAAIFVLSQLDPKKMGIAIGALAGLFSMLSGSMVALTKWTSPAAIGQFAAISMGMIAMSLAALALAAALAKIAKLSWSELGKGLVGLVFCVGLLVVVMKLLSGKKAAVPGVGGVAGEVAADVDMMKSAMMLLAFAASVKVLASALGKIAEAVNRIGSMDLKTLAKGLGGMTLILGELYAFMKYADVDKLSLARAGGIFIIAAAIALIGLSIEKMGAMNVAQMIKGLGVLSAVLVALAVFNKSLGGNTGMEANAAGVLALAGALIMISVALRILGGMDIKSMVKSMTMLGGILLGLSLAIKSMSGSELGAAGLLATAAAVLALAVAMRIIGKMSVKSLAKALVGIAAAFGILVGMGYALAPIADVLDAVGLALLMMGGAVFLAGAGLMLFNLALAGFVALGAAGLAAMTTMIIGMAKTIPLVAAEVAKGIGAFISELTLQIPVILAFLTKLIEGVITMLITLLPKIVPLVTAAIQMLIQIIDQNARPIIDCGMRLIMSFLGGIRDNIGDIVNVVGDILIAFLSAFGKKVPEVVNQLFLTIIDIINGLAKAIRDNSQALVDAIKNLILAIVDAFGKLAHMFVEIGGMILKGIAKGLGGVFTEVGDAIKGLGSKIKNGFCSLLGINSPSTVFAGYGVNIGEGLIVGLKTISGKASAAASSIGDGVSSGMKKGLSSIKDALTMDVDINPTIRPVVDMTDVQNGITSTFNQVPTIDVSATKGKAASTAASYSTVAAQKYPGGTTVDKSNNPTIQIVQHNTVRNDTDIKKISQDLNHMVDRYAAAKGRVVAPA